MPTVIEAHLTDGSQISKTVNIENQNHEIHFVIPKGKKIELSDINWVRLSGGLAPGNEKKIVKKTSLRNIKLGKKIRLHQIK